MLDIVPIKHLIYPDHQNKKVVVVIRWLMPSIHYPENLLVLLFALAAVLTRKCTEQASTGVLQKQVPVGKTAMLADAQVCLSSKRNQ
ncbi:MAG: hypothetical protein ACKVK0_14670, partial [Pirellulales bacterium]